MSDDSVSINDISVGDLGDAVVVIAVDKSKQSEDAFDKYLDNLYRPDHQVVLVNVPQEPTTHTCRGAHLRDSDWQKMERREKEDTSKIVGTFSAKCKQRKLKANYKTLYGGKPEEVIVEAAAQLQAMLLVVGCHERGVIRRTIQGSVSDYVLKNAKTSVFVCRGAH
ncbi:hypothetical protein NP493_72g03010 [Ridgeia piscesae]|uniref:UspA domain-containing protein n=1 Tax=Ridgeia piscesae TaxID=27915 RepID=A0AAD9P9K9_RIDPI|nr:hypothetical protein NP493_72g03010 [Ridgeia piscesae]